MLIDRHGTIGGFTFGIPDQKQVQAVPEGAAAAVDDDATEDQPDALFEERAVRLEARPLRFGRPTDRPELPPPSDEVHISASRTEGTVSSTAPDRWLRRGFGLRAILAELLDTTPNRIELPTAPANDARHDFVFVSPRRQDTEAITRHVRNAIEGFFRVAIIPELRRTDVYVVTGIVGKTPPKQSGERDFGVGSIAFSAPSAVPDELQIPEGALPNAEGGQ